MGTIPGVLVAALLAVIVLLLVEPHLYRRFGIGLLRWAFERDTRQGNPTAKSFRTFEIVVRVSVVVPLSIILVLFLLSLATNGANQ